jgi:hypothetical protein
MESRSETVTAASAPRHAHDGSYVDWPAILAGAVAASAIGLLFGSFGATLGLSAISPQPDEGAGGFALIIVGAWMLVTLLVSYGAGGYIAGRMRRRVDGASADEVTARDSIHGLVVWALGVLIGAWVLTGALGTAATTAGNVAGAVGQTAAAAATAGGAAAAGTLPGEGANPLDIVNDRLLRGTGVQVDENPDFSSETANILADVAVNGEMTEGDANYLAEQLSANSNLSEADARARVDTAAQEVVRIREEAEQTARDAADAARRAAVLSGFALAAGLLIAAAAAVWASAIGGRHRDEGRLFAGFRTF